MKNQKTTLIILALMLSALIAPSALAEDAPPGIGFDFDDEETTQEDDTPPNLDGGGSESEDENPPQLGGDNNDPEEDNGGSNNGGNNNDNNGGNGSNEFGGFLGDGNGDEDGNNENENENENENDNTNDPVIIFEEINSPNDSNKSGIAETGPGVAALILPSLVLGRIVTRKKQK